MHSNKFRMRCLIKLIHGLHYTVFETFNQFGKYIFGHVIETCCTSLQTKCLRSSCAPSHSLMKYKYWWFFFVQFQYLWKHQILPQKGLKLTFRSSLKVEMSFWWRVLSSFVLCHFCSSNNKKVSIIHQYESSNTPNSNFITIWATEMAQYKIWQCSSPETHFYHQQASKGKL